jgi:hypothetical protein
MTNRPCPVYSDPCLIEVLLGTFLNSHSSVPLFLSTTMDIFYNRKSLRMGIIIPRSIFCHLHAVMGKHLVNSLTSQRLIVLLYR